MTRKYAEYDDDDGVARFGEIASAFDFDLPQLGVQRFPEQFVTDYVSILLDIDAEDRRDDDGRKFIVAHFENGPDVLYETGLFAPSYIYSVNRLLATSHYAPEGSVILPPGYFAIGGAHGKGGEAYIMAHLVQDEPEYGQIYAWRKSLDAFGTGTNTVPPAFLAPRLSDFIARLTTEDAARARLPSQ